ncbi:MAG: 4-hydroxy-tetrahydrodipicolinate reductase [Salinivirgaceae bacterium]|nr:4-hydroxy-tetrahydrodipicolinate reductase [Salinivirgaceae bacterium]
MNIAIIGYGQMGKEIEKIAKERGHTISLIIDKSNESELDSISKLMVDVAIEFSRPESAYINYKKCFSAGIPVVSGTTGWLDKLPEIVASCEANNAGFFYASNFSLGVNLFFQLNRNFASLMNNFNDYSVSINEIHHTRKLDAPSGTAITLAEGLMAELNAKSTWVNNESAKENEIPIISFREGDVPGTHEVIFDSEIDTISIKHEAKSRKGFALGAVIAAEFLNGKTGFYGMNDLLKIS